MLHNNGQNQNPNAKSLTLLIKMRKYFKALFQQNIFWMMYLISVHFQCCMFTPFVYYVVLNTDNQTIKRLRLVRVSCNLSTVFIYHTCYIYSNLVNLTIHYQTLYDTVCTHAFMHYHPLYMLDNIILQLFMFRVKGMFGIHSVKLYLSNTWKTMVSIKTYLHSDMF